MRRLYVLNAGADRLLPLACIAESLAEHAYDVQCFPPNALKLEHADILLVLGVGNWWNDATRTFLAEARERGVHRILWQLEPLLPPSATSALDRQIRSITAARDLQSGNLAARLRRVQDDLHLAVLRWAARREPWCTHSLSAHAFKFPVHQSRCILDAARAQAFDRILVSLAPRKSFLAERGIESRFVPVGYARDFGRTLCVEKDIDVLFLGHVSSRRNHFLEVIRRRLQDAGFSLKVVRRDCYGEERTELVNRAKIVINLLKFPWEFPGIRLLIAMSCRALVVSEPAPDTAPYVAGKHFIVSVPDKLADALIEQLRNKDERARVVDAAYEHVTGSLRFGNLLANELT